MADDLDLETGIPGAGEPESPAARRRRARREGGGSSGGGGSSSRSSGSSSSGGSSERSESKLVTELDEIFGSLAESRQAQGDEELAVALAEEGHKMSVGLVSATRRVPFLRMPLLVILSIVTPILAFHRVGGILFRRYVERRQMITAQQLAEQDEYAAAAAATGEPVI